MDAEREPRTDRARAEEEAVADYADRILNHRDETDWPELNRAIIDRWSMTALRRIKERAWASLAERQAVR